MIASGSTPVGYHGGQDYQNPNKWQWAVAVDHVGVTRPECTRKDLLALIQELQGGEGRESGGRHGYAQGISWGEGTFLWWGGKSQADTCHASIAGELVEHRPWDEQTGILRELSIGGTFTSLHLAFDIMADHPTGIIDDVRRWFEHGYVRNYRTSAEYTNRGEVDGEIISTGGGIYFGSEKSPRRVLTYDKGAKLGTSIGQRHVRLEGRYRKDHAHEYAMRLLSDPTPVHCAGLVLGSIDVRDETGHPPGEYLDLVQLIGQVEPVAVAREATSYDGWVTHVRKQLGRRVANMAWLSGLSPADVLADLVADIQPEKPQYMDRCLREYHSGL